MAVRHDTGVTLQLIKYYYVIFGLTPIVLSALCCLLMHFYYSDPGYQKQGHENNIYIVVYSL